MIYNERDEIQVREDPEMLAFSPIEAFRLAIGLMQALATLPPKDLYEVYWLDEARASFDGLDQYGPGTRHRMIKVLDRLIEKHNFAAFKERVANDE